MTTKNTFSKGSFLLISLVAVSILLSCKKDTEVPEPEFTYAGDYNGFWNTTANGNRNFSDQVSARFSEPDENIFVGTFYYSANWNSCCGAAHDGEISFKVEGDSLKNLIFNQDFRCSGTFAGEGIVNDDGNLAFKIQGPDCFGNHIGTLLLRKQD